MTLWPIMTKFVDEEDKIKAQCHDIQDMVGLLSPDNSGEVQIVDYKQACFQENNEYYWILSLQLRAKEICQSKWKGKQWGLKKETKSNIMLHIIKTIFCFLLSPFRALHYIIACRCKKRLRKNLLPTKVSEYELMTYYDKICGKKTDSKLSMVGLLSPDNSDEVQNVFSRASVHENQGINLLWNNVKRNLPIQMKSNIMLHIIKTIVSFLLSPFRALHNWICKKRLQKYLRLELPKKVCEASLRNEEDSIKASKQLLSSDNLTKEDHIVNYDRTCFQEYDNHVQGKLEHNQWVL